MTEGLLALSALLTRGVSVDLASLVASRRNLKKTSIYLSVF